ncbi:MAG: nucleoside kinase [Lachnospiraceae bacterium]|jgi:uridine kinase|nr:nucleoside kinase [Lachnospiraceae bacterium]
MINITVNGTTKEFENNVKVLAIAESFCGKNNDIVLAKVNGKLKELWKTVNTDAEVELYDALAPEARKTYERALLYVFIKAVHDCFTQDEITSVSVEYSIGNAIYCELHGPAARDENGGHPPVTVATLNKIRARMEEIIAANLKFEKHTLTTEEAVKRFKACNLTDKERLFKYRRVSTTNVYELDGYTDYFYGYMPSRTGILKYYDILGYDRGIMVVIPESGDMNPPAKPTWEPRKMLFNELHESSEWGKLMGIRDVGDLNNTVAAGDIQDMILVQEALQEKRIGQIAEMIAKEKSKRVVLIAGPSSSGKTTFSHRLSIELRTFGLHPHPLGMDDYFVERENTPKDENGNYDFECLEALDIKLFNDNINDLLAGKEVAMPTYNFKTGKREYRGNTLKLGPEDILVIEGIHGLDPKLSYQIPDESKFKIYISALTQLNIDEHNRIPTTDGRLLRRMVRDARTRGHSAAKTIKMWPSVRKGEEKYIFPFQEEADVMFNSALIYELAVLKQYAEPLLFGIDKSEPEYVEAKRLLKFLDYFVGVPADEIPNNSICREFVGGSYFPV